MNEWEWQLLEDKAPVDHLVVDGVELRAGDRVRLRPREGGDILDLALAGKIAMIESIEQDYEGKFQVAVVLDDDPGRDLGIPAAARPSLLLQSERSGAAAMNAPRILIAGIGNIFLGDDGFGVEVAQRLLRRQLPDGVRVVDFGIRGYDLAYALLDGYDAAILVDAAARGGEPGTLYVIEPELGRCGRPTDGDGSARDESDAGAASWYGRWAASRSGCSWSAVSRRRWEPRTKARWG